MARLTVEYLLMALVLAFVAGVAALFLGGMITGLLRLRVDPQAVSSPLCFGAAGLVLAVMLFLRLRRREFTAAVKVSALPACPVCGHPLEPAHGQWFCRRCWAYRALPPPPPPSPAGFSGGAPTAPAVLGPPRWVKGTLVALLVADAAALGTHFAFNSPLTAVLLIALMTASSGYYIALVWLVQRNPPRMALRRSIGWLCVAASMALLFGAPGFETVRSGVAGILLIVGFLLVPRRP